MSARLRFINALHIAAGAARAVGLEESQMMEGKRMLRWAELLEAEARGLASMVKRPLRVFTNYRKGE
jgi:hypothetical protein